MDKIKAHKEGLKLAATNFLKTVFADDQAAFGKFGFLEKNPFDQRYPRYFHRIKPYSADIRRVNEYEDIRKEKKVGGVEDFFKKGNQLATINLSDTEVEGLRLLYPGVEITSIDVPDLMSSEPIKAGTGNHFDGVLVSNIGALGHGESTFVKITQMCHRNALLRADNLEEQVFGIPNHKNRLFDLGWDIYIPKTKDGKTFEIVTAVLQ